MALLRKAFSLLVFFIGLSLASYAQSITHTASPVKVGCPDTFRTTLTGSLYQWEFGTNAFPHYISGSNLQSAPAVFMTPGMHKVYVWVTTAGNVIVQDSLSVTVQSNTSNISITPSVDSICLGQQITYTASPTGFFTYAFFLNDSLINTSTNPQHPFDNLKPGDSVRVMGFNQVCFTNPSPAAHPVIFPIPPPPTLSSSIANDTICGGDEVIFTAMPTGYDSYTFVNNGSVQQSGPSHIWTTTQLGSGNNIFVYVKENGCSSGYSIAIATVVKTTPSITFPRADTAICEGATLKLTASTTNTLATPDHFDFTLNSIAVQSSSDSSYTSSSYQDGDVLQAIGSLIGCPSQAVTIRITVNPIPTVTLSSNAVNDSVCQGQPVTFTAAPPGYDAYSFYNGSTVVQNSSSATYTTNGLADGNSVSVVATDIGCASPHSNSIVTAIKPGPAVQAGADQASCISAPADTLTGFNPAGGAWTGQGITDPSGIFTPNSAGAGNHFLTYTYIDPLNGCPGYDSIAYQVNALPVIGLPPSIDICETQSVQLNAAGGTIYAWSPPDGLDRTDISNPLATPSQNTTYSVTVTDNNGCIDSSSVTINVNPAPAASFTTTNACIGDSIVFTNTTTSSGSSTYTWNFDDGNISTDDNPSHWYSSADSFHVMLIAQLGNCFDTAFNTVTVFPIPVADFKVNTFVSYNDNASPVTFIDLSTDADTWSWDLGDLSTSTSQSPSHVYQQTGQYTITLIAGNQLGCSDSMTKVNYVSIYENPRVFVPNAFTPTGPDNNRLRAFTTGTNFFDFSIYNRIGERVYQSNNPADGWDGNYKGAPAQLGVYSYFLKIVFEDNAARTYKGSITLLR